MGLLCCFDCLFDFVCSSPRLFVQSNRNDQVRKQGRDAICMNLLSPSLWFDINHSTGNYRQGIPYKEFYFSLQYLVDFISFLFDLILTFKLIDMYEIPE